MNQGGDFCNGCLTAPRSKRDAVTMLGSSQVFLKDLEWGRRQQSSFLKRLHFLRVERGIRETLRMLDKDMPPAK